MQIPPCVSTVEPPSEQVEEEKRTVLACVVINQNTMFAKYSSISTLTRISAHMFRFSHNCRVSADKRRSGPLTRDETDAAFLFWVKTTQREEFSQEIDNLISKRPISSSSRLLCLNPFLDAMGIVRVGGRLRHAKINIERKFQILLPRKHTVTTLIIRQEHLRNLHAGPQLLLATLHQRFWVMCGRDVVRQCIRRCVTCCRQQAETPRPKMGDLPEPRVSPARPFMKCGVDYAGPFNLRALKIHGQKTYKAYVALFICFATRAIHLELVSDLTTDAFIAALKIFAFHRGIGSDMYSDCGTNFVGANKELQLFLKLTQNQVHNEKLTRHLAKVDTRWHFNPPSAPHFGGMWEAGVKSVKYHLRRIVGPVNLNFEEMYTILTQFEACLNSRPLCHISNDPNDFSALTPEHFLIGDAMTAIPESEYTALKVSRLNKVATHPASSPTLLESLEP